jgi:hypothetical protein
MLPLLPLPLMVPLLPPPTPAPLRPLRSSILSSWLVASSAIIHLLPQFQFEEGAALGIHD